MTLEELVKCLKREPGVNNVWLMGSALTDTAPNDLDIVVNLGVDGRPEDLLEKYMNVLICYRGREVPIDLHIHSTNVPISDWAAESYSRPEYKEL